MTDDAQKPPGSSTTPGTPPTDGTSVLPAGINTPSLSSLSGFECQVAQAWMDAIREAWSLARGRRLAELRDHRVNRLDGRGIEPYSCAWGRIYAYEGLVPYLAELRLLKAEPSQPLNQICTPYTMWKRAREDAIKEFTNTIRGIV